MHEIEPNESTEKPPWGGRKLFFMSNSWQGIEEESRQKFKFALFMFFLFSLYIFFCLVFLSTVVLNFFCFTFFRDGIPGNKVSIMLSNVRWSTVDKARRKDGRIENEII